MKNVETLKIVLEITRQSIVLAEQNQYESNMQFQQRIERLKLKQSDLHFELEALYLRLDL